MDIRKTTKGTLFRLFRETFIITSDFYYSPRYGIHMVKAHNITKGIDEQIGEIAMCGAHALTQETK